jgi:hypothetical protein
MPLALVTLLLAAGAASPPPTAWAVRQLALSRVPLMQSMARDREILQSVASKNLSGETLQDIKRKDEAWTGQPGLPLRRQLTDSACAERLRQLGRSDPLVVEVILMDARGANVCISRETSDYWQGDEPKFQRTFGAREEVFLDSPALDASSGTYAVQLSGLVYDGDSPIGAITLTLRVKKDALAQQR